MQQERERVPTVTFSGLGYLKSPSAARAAKEDPRPGKGKKNASVMLPREELEKKIP